MRLAILGAGAWGTALALSFARQHTVTLLAREEAQVEAMRASGENRRYLSGCPLPPTLTISADTEMLEEAELALIATPVAGLRAALTRLQSLPEPPPFLWLCKGLEAASGLLPHQVALETAPATLAHGQYGALSGPSFAEEVARGLPAALTLAATDAAFAARMARVLAHPRLRIYASDDLIGVEVGGAVKNVLAIATGICDGLGLGANARAALLTRGLAEMTRFGVALGARFETFMGLAGLGDLALTATGDLSRNRRVGLALAQGRDLSMIIRDLGHVAEGVPAAHEVNKRAAALGVEMPITAAVCAVLEGRLLPLTAVEALMSRDAKAEHAY